MRQNMKPTKSEFKKYAEKHNLVPVYAELLADMETPLSAFSKVKDREGSFLLESAEAAEKFGRYSFIGFEPKAVFSIKDSRASLKFADGKEIFAANKEAPFEPLREYLKSLNPAKLEELPYFFGGAVGFISYESVSYFAKVPKAKNSTNWEDARFGIYDNLIVFDNVRHTVKIVSCAHIDEFESVDEAYEAACTKVLELIKIYRGARPEIKEQAELKINLKPNMPKEDFLEMVNKAKQYIKDGEAIQLVLSQKFSSESQIEPLAAYRALRFINPSPYMFCFKCAERHLVGSSPETLVRFQNGRVNVSPIAGTRPRGKTEAQDMNLADELLSNEKERAEHLMLVDLGRNDISRFCEAGSVQLESFMEVQRYSHVMHLVSHIKGEAKKGADAFDALAATFPAGTLSGAPKRRAMELINFLEPEARGPYGGAVGYMGYGGAMDLAITIRTLQIEKNKLSVQAGAGIVYDSDPEAEYEETKAKASAVAKAIEASSKLELHTDEI